MPKLLYFKILNWLKCNKIKKMSSILYKNQRSLKQKPIYDPDEFKNILEIADADLIGFFWWIIWRN